MKKKLIIAVIIASFLALAGYLTGNAKKNYALKGNSIICLDDKNISKGYKTEFTYEVKGTQYPIYTSPKGRCYILKVSKKTNKEYKYYLPKEADSLIQVQLKRK